MRKFTVKILLLATILIPHWGFADKLPEIRIFSSTDELIDLYSGVDYWGKLDPGKILDVPPYLVVATQKTWSKQAAALRAACTAPSTKTVSLTVFRTFLTS